LNPASKEMMTKMFNSITERERNIFFQLEDDNMYMAREVKKLGDNVDKILKTKNILKREKLKKKALKQLKESAKLLYETVAPRKETYLFHLLLDSITRINYLLKTESKIWVSSDGTFNEEFNIEFTERILKKVKSIDSRSMTFLKSIIKYNDMVINNELLEEQINKSKNTVELSDEKTIKYLIKEYDFLKEIMKSTTLGLTSIEALEFKYNKKEIREFKYNFTRVKNFVQEIEKELKIFDIIYNCGKYKKLVLESFLDGEEKMTHESVASYLEYLIWLDKKGKLEEEYQLIS